MTINLPIRFDENCRLGFLEIVLQDIKISKFSRGACFLPPPPSKIPIYQGPSVGQSTY